MRLISQDGMIDVPYEQVSVELKDCDIWCGYYPTLSQRLISKKFATYVNTDKALKVMEMLRNKYSKFEIFKSVYQKGLLTELNKELGFDEMQNTLTPVFQFPADEEVEV